MHVHQAKTPAFDGLFPPLWFASIAFNGVFEAEQPIAPHRFSTSRNW
jgi:hypothetical protein